MDEAAEPAGEDGKEEGEAGPRRYRPRSEGGSRRDHVLPAIRVTAAERAAIEAGAERVQMSTAAYLRALGLGYDPPSKDDLRAIHELGRLRADLGRLGGLLKLWLTDRAGEGTEASNVSRVLTEIEQRQTEIEAAVVRL